MANCLNVAAKSFWILLVPFLGKNPKQVIKSSRNGESLDGYRHG